MPDGPRRSVRIAELTKKPSISEVKVTESYPERGRRVGKGKPGVVKPLQPPRNPPPKKSATERPKTQARKALERPKNKQPNLEHQSSGRKEHRRQRFTKETATQQAKRSKNLLLKYLIILPVRLAFTDEARRNRTIDADPEPGLSRVNLSREALQRLETATADDPFPEDLSAVSKVPHQQGLCSTLCSTDKPLPIGTCLEPSPTKLESR